MANLIIVKVGGNAISQLSPAFFTQIKNWQRNGKKVLLIHGGGPQINHFAAQLGILVKKYQGMRVTDAATLELSKMVLLGISQPALLTQLSQAGISAVGLNAADQRLLTGQLLDWENLGYVGQIMAVNQVALTRLTNRQVGVLAPLALTPKGQWLNVNADSAAAAIAQLMHASALYLLTDVPGVLKDGHLLNRLVPQQVDQLLHDDVITAGMQPKLSAAMTALDAGVQQVMITNQLAGPGTVLSKEAVDE